MTDLDREKELAAHRAVRFVSDGMVVGLGTGSTAEHAIRMLGTLARGGHHVTCVPTSERTAALARQVGLSLVSPEAIEAIDVTIDGADEILANGDAIKGAGGALVREKIVATASRHVVFIVDSSKLVTRLGGRPVPFEVVPFGWSLVARRLDALGLTPVLRTMAAGEAFRSENGNYILDARLRAGVDLPDDEALRGIAGVVDHGVFRGIARHVVVGRGDGVEVFERA